MRETEKCRACASALEAESLVRLNNMPGAVQNLPEDDACAVSASVVLDVRQCARCGLVQLTNDPVPYYKDVIRAGSFSPSMRMRQREAFQTFIDRFSLSGKNIIEIGSGRGEYLSILNALPVHAYGMEHHLENNRMAEEKGLKTFQAYPTDVTEPPGGILFDGFISINFLEHAPDPGAFLRACAKLLSEAGVGMIAVPDLEFELNDNFLFSFMSDHLSYFSAESLRNTLCLNGFDVIDVRRNRDLNVVTAYVQKRRTWDISAPRKRFSRFNQTLNAYMDTIVNQGGRIALWGASHLAFSIVSASQTSAKIAYIVDSAPFKQGRYAPASGLAIHPPQQLASDPVDTVIVMCPEYSDEIVSVIRENYAHVVTGIATFTGGGLETIPL